MQPSHALDAARLVRLAYQPPASSTFLSKQTSHQQPASSTFLSEQTSTSHQPPANRTNQHQPSATSHLSPTMKIEFSSASISTPTMSQGDFNVLTYSDHPRQSKNTDACMLMNHDFYLART
jgi:hypothetical protein